MRMGFDGHACAKADVASAGSASVEAPEAIKLRRVNFAIDLLPCSGLVVPGACACSYGANLEQGGGAINDKLGIKAMHQNVCDVSSSLADRGRRGPDWLRPPCSMSET